MSVISYSTIKAIAAENGARVADLLALAPANDPFYVGRPSQVTNAEWFREQWETHQYGSGMHLRRIHYQLMNQETPPKMPSGNTYENTNKCWSFLNLSAKHARYLGYVPIDNFVDRRNPAAVIYRQFFNPDEESYLDPTPGYAYGYDEDVGIPEWDAYSTPYVPELPALPELPLLPITGALGYYGIEQPELLEIWVEKSTMHDILIPLCQKYHINLITGVGEMSISSVRQLLHRIITAQRPCRVLYVSDYDPAGLGMPISIGRKIEFFQRQNETNQAITLEPVVLTSEQVAHYKLPRVPGKPGDKRKNNWARDHGKDNTELDALEAIHPGELHTIVEQTILKYYDPTLVRRAIRERSQLQSELNDLTLDVYHDHRTDLRNLNNNYNRLQDEYAQTRAAFDDLVAPFQRQLNGYEQRIAAIRQQAERVHAQILDDLQQLDVDIAGHPLPDPDLPDATDDLLYMSGRGYAEQLQFYKHYRHNTKE